MVTRHGSVADETPERERRRSIASLGAALLVHAALLAALAVGIGAVSAPATLPVVTIQLEGSSVGGLQPAASAGAPAGGGPAQGAAASASATSSGQSSGFVIPTPQGQPGGSPGPSGPAFQEAGGRTGQAQSIPSTPSAQSGPVVPPVRQGNGSGAGASSGSGAASAQRSGTAVAVGSSNGNGGPLDLSSLDKGLARGPAGGTGSGGAARSGGGGTGSGSGTGSGGAGAGSFAVQWGSSAGEGRRLVVEAKPKLPAWVSRAGAHAFRHRQLLGPSERGSAGRRRPAVVRIRRRGLGRHRCHPNVPVQLRPERPHDQGGHPLRDPPPVAAHGPGAARLRPTLSRCRPCPSAGRR